MRRPAHGKDRTPLRTGEGADFPKGRARLGFGYRILQTAGQEILTGTTMHLCTSVAGKARRLPEELVRALTPYCQGPSHATM